MPMHMMDRLQSGIQEAYKGHADIQTPIVYERVK